MSKNVFIASDHGGIYLKDSIIQYLRLKYPEFEVINLGTDSLNNPVDYPHIAKNLCKKMKHSYANDYGILICKTGIGMSIAANRFDYIRAALCCNNHTAKLSREHNNANVMCLGASLLSLEEANDMVSVFLLTGFDVESRHQARVNQLFEKF